MQRSRFTQDHNPEDTLQLPATEDEANIDSVSRLMRDGNLDLAFSEVVAQATAQAEEQDAAPDHGETQGGSSDALFRAEQVAMEGQDNAASHPDDQPATAAQREQLQRLIDVSHFDGDLSLFGGDLSRSGGDIIVAQGAAPHQSHSPGGTAATTSAQLRALLRAPRSLDPYTTREDAGREDGSDEEDDSEADYVIDEPSYLEQPHERCRRFTLAADLDMVDPLKVCLSPWLPLLAGPRNLHFLLKSWPIAEGSFSIA